MQTHNGTFFFFFSQQTAYETFIYFPFAHFVFFYSKLMQEIYSQCYPESPLRATAYLYPDPQHLRRRSIFASCWILDVSVCLENNRVKCNPNIACLILDEHFVR